MALKIDNTTTKSMCTYSVPDVQSNYFLQHTDGVNISFFKKNSICQLFLCMCVLWLCSNNERGEKNTQHVEKPWGLRER